MSDLGRPIRPVIFGGPYLQPGAVEFAAQLEAHPQIDLLMILCQGEGAGLRPRLANLWRRRGPVAIAVLALEISAALGRFLRNPRRQLAFRRRAAPALAKVSMVPDVHALEVLERLRALAPDLGALYGGPILEPRLFEIPSFGTLGIHHGRVPQYRGKKTTFWEMYNGESVAGVTIQRVNAGIDTGDIVRTGEVHIGRKGYARVEREVELLGFELYLQAVLDIKRGTAPHAVPQDPGAARARSYRQPSARDILRFYLRRWARPRAPSA